MLGTIKRKWWSRTAKWCSSTRSLQAPLIAAMVCTLRSWPEFPGAVVRRAEEILHSLEQDDSVALPANRRGDGAGAESELQLTMFGEPDPIIEDLKNLDVMSITPIEALAKLYELQGRLGGDSEDEE